MMTTEAPEGMSHTSGKNRWFQLGLVSAGAAAPLIARWRALRAAEQAETLREQANERWNDALAWVAQSRPQAQEALQETLRQAAPQAQESLRQVSAAAREALRRLPGTPSSEAAAPTMSATSAAQLTNRRVNATLWAVGVGVGLVAAGAVAYIVLRNRIAATSDNDALVEIPLTAVTPTEALTGVMTPTEAAAAAMASEGPAIVEEPQSEEPGIAETPTFDENDAEGAAYIGNILSRVYHPAGSKRLPAPQHRIYFATQDEAEEAGYRPDNAELASRGSEIAGQ